MKRFVLSALIAICAPLHAAELVPAQVPATAKWQLHADMDTMRSSATGSAIFAYLEARFGVKLQAFKRISSVHLLHDLHGVTLFGDGQPDHAVALLAGNFNRDHIEDVVKAADQYSATDFEGVTIHTWKDHHTTQHAAFAKDGLLVFSRQENALKSEITLLKANIPATADPIFTAHGGKPLLAAIADLSGIPLPADASKILRLTTVLRMAATENNGRFAVHMNADCPDATRADQMRRMLDGVAAMVESAEPRLGEAGLKSSMTVREDKPGVNVEVSMPVASWLEILRKTAEECPLFNK
jgi:hypothetical protein